MTKENIGKFIAAAVITITFCMLALIGFHYQPTHKLNLNGFADYYMVCERVDGRLVCEYAS